jgi:glycogen debranching enzyme
MSRHQQNFAWQYHNGGVWPMVGGFWVLALTRAGYRDLAWMELAKLARAAALNDWEFNEWLHGETHVPSGMPRQSWNAATFLWAEHMLRTGEDVFLRSPT